MKGGKVGWSGDRNVEMDESPAKLLNVGKVGCGHSRYSTLNIKPNTIAAVK